MDVEKNIKVLPPFFITVLTKKFKIVIDCGVCCPKHGESIVNAINGIYQNAIIWLTIKKVGAADVATKEDSKDIEIFTAIDSWKKEELLAAAEYAIVRTRSPIHRIKINK